MGKNMAKKKEYIAQTKSPPENIPSDEINSTFSM